jgi:hypothetical protein
MGMNMLAAKVKAKADTENKKELNIVAVKPTTIYVAKMQL